MFEPLGLKDACFIELEFQWEVWLIQNLKCFFAIACPCHTFYFISKLLKFSVIFLPKIVPLNILILVV